MNKPRFTKTEFRRALDDSAGHIGVIAGRLGVDRRTVYRYLNRYPELQSTLQKERQSGRDEIVELAQSELMKKLKVGDERVIMFALRHYDREGVPGAVDIGSLFTPDVQEYLKSIGANMSDVVKQFEDIIRAQAEKVKTP
jgi:predicted transcriptional regulator